MDIIKVAERISQGFGRNQGHTRAVIEGAKAACGFENTYPVVVFGSSEHDRFAKRHLETPDGSLYALGMTSLSRMEFPKFENKYSVPVLFDSHAVVMLARGLLKEISDRDEQIERLKGGDEYLKKKALAKLSKEERIALGLETDVEELVEKVETARGAAFKFEEVPGSTEKLELILGRDLVKTSSLVQVAYRTLESGVEERVTGECQFVMLKASVGAHSLLTNADAVRDSKQAVERALFRTVAPAIRDSLKGYADVVGHLVPPSWIQCGVTGASAEWLLSWYPCLMPQPGVEFSKVKQVFQDTLAALEKSGVPIHFDQQLAQKPVRRDTRLQDLYQAFSESLTVEALDALSSVFFEIYEDRIESVYLPFQKWQSFRRSLFPSARVCESKDEGLHYFVGGVLGDVKVVVKTGAGPDFD